MTKSLRNKTVSKRLKQRIRGGDKMSSAARKIKNLAQKGQSKKKNKGSKKTQKTVRKRSKRSIRGGTKSDDKKNRSPAQKVQSAFRGYFSRKNTPQEQKDELNEKMRVAVNKVKDSKCSICQEMIRVPEDMTSCANNHNFHKDCILGWCKSWTSRTQVDPDDPTKSVTTCPICKTATIVCPGDIEEIDDARHRDQNQMNADSLEETRRLYAAAPTEWNREYYRLITGEREREREREMAARQPIPETEEQMATRLAWEEREMEERAEEERTRRVAHQQQDQDHNRIEEIIIISRDELKQEMSVDNNLTKQQSERIIGKKLEDKLKENQEYLAYISRPERSWYTFEPSRRDLSGPISIAVKHITETMVEYCVQHILLPEMKSEFDALANGRTYEQIHRELGIQTAYENRHVVRTPNEQREREREEEKNFKAYSIHRDMEKYLMSNVEAEEGWWRRQNKRMIDIAKRDIIGYYGDIVALVQEEHPQTNPTRKIGEFSFKNIDEEYLYNFCGIYSTDIEHQKSWSGEGGLFEQLQRNDAFERRIEQEQEEDEEDEDEDEDNVKLTYGSILTGNPTTAEREEITEKLKKRKIRSGESETGGVAYNTYIDMNKHDFGGINIYIGTEAVRETNGMVDIIWAIYGPGGVYATNNNGTALLRSREEVNR